MSEEKVIQHTEKIIHTISDKNKKWKQKIVEIIQEVLIIVFAVSLTLWLHNWNDRRHERKMEKEFLIGIRGDISNASNSLQASAIYLKSILKIYDSLCSQILSNKINASYADSNSNDLDNNFYFSSNSARFEGFKSSGNLRILENKTLANHIISFFDNDLPFQRGDENSIFNHIANNIHDNITNYAHFSPSGNRIISNLFNKTQVQNAIFENRDLYSAAINSKNKLSDEGKKLVAEIDNELKENF